MCEPEPGRISRESSWGLSLASPTIRGPKLRPKDVSATYPAPVSKGPCPPGPEPHSDQPPYNRPPTSPYTPTLSLTSPSTTPSPCHPGMFAAYGEGGLVGRVVNWPSTAWMFRRGPQKGPANVMETLPGAPCVPWSPKREGSVWRLLCISFPVEVGRGLTRYVHSASTWLRGRMEGGGAAR